MMLMAACSGGAEFAAADLHAGQAARIGDRYDLPTVAAAVSIYRATRAALNGDSAAAAELYRQAAAQLGRLRLGLQGGWRGLWGGYSLRIGEDGVGDITGDVEGAPRMPAVSRELYALGLAAAGRAAGARAVAPPLRPTRRDRRWLFQTGIRGLLAIALDDHERAESAYQALLPFAARPAGADTMLVTLWPVAQILPALARSPGIPGAQAHYEPALAIAEHAHVEPGCEAAIKRMD